MKRARWDLAFLALQPPLHAQGELVRRGPVVVLGANPGPGGLSLHDYRALEARHAVATVYEGGQVSLAPTGTGQVRLAPHANVEWSAVEPLRAPAWLAPGSALHLGPLGRGVTLLFVEARPLGAWEGEGIAAVGGVGEAYELQPNRKVPAWFVGGVVALGLGLAVALVLPTLKGHEVVPLGPKDEGLEIYVAAPAELAIDPSLVDGFDQAYDAFVLRDSARVAEDPELRGDRARWDAALLAFATRSAQQHMGARRFWARLEQIVDDYAYVVTELRAAGLPEVFAAIPYRESGYRPDAQSPVCAKGYWQLMPEVAHRVDVAVSGCALRGRMEGWAPTALTPVRGVAKNAPYTRDGACLIPALRGCAVDERSSLEISTGGAIRLLQEAWEDPVFQASGAAVALTIASHNAGYDDARFGADFAKSTNVLPAYRRALAAQGVEADPRFIGSQIRCPGPTGADDCGAQLPPETQHYVYPVLAQHFLAVCYYARNHGDREAFRPWRELNDGYCARLPIPTSEESKQWM